MHSLPYEIVDVFTDRPYTGNPLAVVFDADGLATEAMQAIAVEFNLSETIFVLPPTTPDATYRVRIFTPGAELPFAGHPSVGAAVTQMRRGLIAAGEVIQECGAGLLPVRVTADGTARLTGGTATVGDPFDPEPLLDTLGLDAADFVGPAPRVAGCGLAFHYLSVRREALARSFGDAAAARRHGVTDVSGFWWDADTRTAYTRVFVPGLGVAEDPATGSAALGFGVWAVTSGLLPADGTTAYTVIQGVEMGRPSRLDCAVTSVAGQVTTATVTGSVVPVATGAISPPS
jgi:trans-2,3-dihydro-3-hydroxyanthranilate isomerase